MCAVATAQRPASITRWLQSPRPTGWSPPHPRPPRLQSPRSSKPQPRGGPEGPGEVARKLSPPQEASLIAELIRRDLPFYDASISRDFVSSMNRFARELGILQGEILYD